MAEYMLLDANRAKNLDTGEIVEWSDSDLVFTERGCTITLPNGTFEEEWMCTCPFCPPGTRWKDCGGQE